MLTLKKNKWNPTLSWIIKGNWVEFKYNWKVTETIQVSFCECKNHHEQQDIETPKQPGGW